MSNEREPRINVIHDFGFKFVFSSVGICRGGKTPCSRQRGHFYVPIEEFYDDEVAVVRVERRNLLPIVMRLNFPSTSNCFSSMCMKASGVCVENPDWRRIGDLELERKIIVFADTHLQERRGQEKPRR